tara:strand:+ start:244 stop:471 length:228 start_codon:yes stop_codon:yes gene_type:complete
MWTEWLTTIGWIYLGVIIGVIFGILVSSLLGASRFGDLEAENQHLRFVRDSLKEEIFRLENQPKPKPRKRRKISR